MTAILRVDFIRNSQTSFICILTCTGAIIIGNYTYITQ